MDPTLLAPSLRDTKIQPIYSRIALFATAFFFGGFGVTTMAALNAHRLGRLKQDGLTLVLCMIATVVVAITTLLLTDESKDLSRIATRGTGFLIWLIFSHLHSEAYRAMETFGTDHPAPYKAFGISFLVFAVMISITAALFMVFVGRAA